MRALLGVAALAAFVFYCFTRERTPRAAVRRASPRAASFPGDGDASRVPPVAVAAAGTRVHAGDPTVRH